MNVETAQSTRQGNRNDNQDRASIVVTDTRILLTVADGMGGHIGGDVAAEAAIDAMVRCFKRQRGNSIRDAGDFMRESIAEAHEAVVMLGSALSPELRPRTTITVCLVADNCATWAHVGDSRIYLLRDRKVVTRTRDHSAVELLVQQGLLRDATSWNSVWAENRRCRTSPSPNPASSWPATWCCSAPTASGRLSMKLT